MTSKQRRSTAGVGGGERGLPLLARVGAVLASAVLVSTSTGVVTASAHYVDPPGEDEAAPAVVQVQIDYNYTVFWPDKQASVKVVVPGPRGSGAVVNSSGAVLTGDATVNPGHTRREDVVAINLAFRARYDQRWTDAQLAVPQRISDQEVDQDLQGCYKRTVGCAEFRYQTRAVVYNTSDGRRLLGTKVSIGGGLGLLSTPADREITPTVGLASDGPQAGGVYRALGWGREGLLAPVPVAFENGAFRRADLETVGSTFANGGDGAVIVDNKSRGNVVAVLLRGDDGVPTSVNPSQSLQFGNVGTDRGPLHPSIDQALGYFQGRHYSHAVPLIQQVTDVLPDRGLVAKLELAKQKQGGPEDLSESASETMGTSAGSPLVWPAVAAGLGLAVVAALAVIGWRRRGRGAPVDGPADELDDLDLEPDKGFEEQPGAAPPQDEGPDRSPDDGARVGEDHPQLARAGTTVKSAGRTAGYCAQCGVSLVAGDRFCYHCGTPAR